MVFPVIRTCLTTFFLSVLFTGCAQSRYVHKSVAFSQTISPGANDVNEKGNSVTGLKTRIYIYLECEGDGKPAINRLSYHGILLYDHPLFFNGNKPVEVGTGKMSGKQITITPGKGNNLWRIEFTLSADQDKLVGKRGNIIINGHKDRKAFIVIIKNEIALTPWVGM